MFDEVKISPSASVKFRVMLYAVDVEVAFIKI